MLTGHLTAHLIVGQQRTHALFHAENRLDAARLERGLGRVLAERAAMVASRVRR